MKLTKVQLIVLVCYLLASGGNLIAAIGNFAKGGTFGGVFSAAAAAIFVAAGTFFYFTIRKANIEKAKTPNAQN